MSFRNESDEVCHLELFHRWHKGELPKRMEFMEKNPEIPLIAGIDRGAVSEEKWNELVRTFPGAAERCFRFRDFPGVDTVLKTLEKIRDKNEKGIKNERKKRKTP